MAYSCAPSASAGREIGRPFPPRLLPPEAARHFGDGPCRRACGLCSLGGPTMRFGRFFKDHARPEWWSPSNRYLDYEALKKAIDDVDAAAAAAESRGGGPSLDPGASVERARRRFRDALDAEIAKVLGFYRLRLGAVERATKDAEDAVVAWEVAASVSGGGNGVSSRAGSAQGGGNGVSSRAGSAQGGSRPSASSSLREPLLAAPPTPTTARVGETAALRRAADFTVLDAIKEATALLEYVALNVTAIRKVLKKFAKHAPAASPRAGYAVLEIGHPDDPTYRVLQGTRLPESYARDLAAMERQEELIGVAETLRELVETLDADDASVAGEGPPSGRVSPFAGGLAEEGAGEERGEGAGERASAPAEAAAPPARSAPRAAPGGPAPGPSGVPPSPPKVAPVPSFVNAIKTPSAGTPFADDATPLGGAPAGGAPAGGAPASAPLPPSSSAALPLAHATSTASVRTMRSKLLEALEDLDEASAGASREALFVRAAPWIQRAAGMFEAPPAPEAAVATQQGLMVNAISTALFMANYTAVLPVVDDLCSRVGVDPGYAGQIMAASDAAAMVTSVLMSWWSNRSFKHPVLFGAISCLLGNAFFCLAYINRSLPLLLVARALNGLGSARTVNRRYNADFVPGPERTAACAIFVGASTLGMAAGPALSVPLAALSPKDPDGLWNPVTNVGWSLAVAWVGFLVWAAVAFDDPPRHLTPVGLLEGDQKSQAARAGENGAPGHGNGGAGDADADADGDEAAGRELSFAPGSPLARLPGRARKLAGQAAERHRARRQLARRARAMATVAPTAACALFLLVQKAVQQGYFDGVALLTGSWFGWGPTSNGIFLALLCLLLAPVNFAVGALSRRLADASVVLFSFFLMLASLLVLSRASEKFPTLFFASGLGVMAGSVALEGAATSLMSKVMWPGLARGLFNAGLLSTEAGTAGRFAGNALIFVAGSLAGTRTLAQLDEFKTILDLSLAVSVIVSLVAFALTRTKLYAGK